MAVRRFSTPGVYLREIDLSEVVVPAGIGSGAISLKAPQGPVNQNVVLTSTEEFLTDFGKPTFTDPDGFMPDYGYGMYAALGFLVEGSYLNVVRVPTVTGTQSGSDRYAIAGTAIKTPSTDGSDFCGNTTVDDLSCMIANGVLYEPGSTIETPSDYTGIIPELNPVNPNKPDQNQDLDGAAPSTDYQFYDYAKLVSDTPTEENISDFVRFYLGSVGPQTAGNDVAYAVEFFSDRADWAYSYDDDEKINELLSKILDPTITIDTTDIDGLIAPKVFRIRVFVKTPNQRWTPPLTTQRYTEVENFYCSLELLQDSDNNSLFMKDVINGRSDYVYAVKSANITDAEIVDLIQNPLRSPYYLTLDGNPNERFFYFNANDTLIDPTNPTGTGKIAWPSPSPAGDAARFDDWSTINNTTCEGVLLENDGLVIPNDGNNYYLGFDFDAAEYAVLLEMTDSSGNVTLDNITYYTVALQPNPNGGGRIVRIVNRDPSLDESVVRSQARAQYDGGLQTIVLPVTELVNRNPLVPDYAAQFGVPMVGGQSIASSDISNVYGWDYFSNRQEVTADIFIVPTHNTIVKQTVANDIVGTRRDSMAVVQSGSLDDTDIQDILEAEQYGYTAASYVATYSGYYRTFDEYNSRFVWLPNMIAAVQSFVRTTNIANPWDAPAGMRKGVVGGIEQNANFNDAQIGIGYDNNINMIKTFRGVGSVIWGQKTAQRKASALDRINVRRTLLFIEKTVEEFLNPLVLDVNNTPTTRARVFGNIDSFLNQIRSQGGLIAYEVVCDESNNTAQVIDNNTLAVDIYVQPVKTVEFIDVQVVITRTGVSFSEVRVR